MTHPYADIIDPAAPLETLTDFFNEIEAMKQSMGDAVTFPPNCFRDMQARFVRYESRRVLVVRIPVTERSLNPVRTMQGGFITAAIDNTIGPLSYVAARRPCMTLDLHTQYLRAVQPGDVLTITGTVTAHARTTLVLTAEAVNSRNKIVAFATANAAII